jgi:hypothetical protein
MPSNNCKYVIRKLLLQLLLDDDDITTLKKTIINLANIIVDEVSSNSFIPTDDDNRLMLSYLNFNVLLNEYISDFNINQYFLLCNPFEWNLSDVKADSEGGYRVFSRLDDSEKLTWLKKDSEEKAEIIKCLS